MEYLKCKTKQMESVGGFYTAKEISRQSELWMQTYYKLLNEKEKIKDFINYIIRKDYPNIILTGAGTSAFIGEALEGPYQKKWGVITRAIATTDLITHPENYFIPSGPTLLISFARYGDSPESVAVVELANKYCNDIYMLSITCNKDGELARRKGADNSLVFLLPEETNDRSLAMTSSFTSMLLAGLLILDLDDLEYRLPIIQNLKNDGMHDAWERVSGLVVQPGVEYGDDQIFKYNRKNTRALSKLILGYDNLVYEAHSTDFQTETSLKEPVEDHFCILKVGPWLTFVFREALFALEAMEVEMFGKNNPDLSRLSATLDNVMVSNPKYWSSYYKGDEKEMLFKRKFSFSDRSRYYWPDNDLEKSKEKLYFNLTKHKIPLSLLSQFMPAEFSKVCEGQLTINPIGLVYSHIRNVAGVYSRACSLKSSNK